MVDQYKISFYIDIQSIAMKRRMDPESIHVVVE